MSARKKALTANPVLDGTLDVPPAPPKPPAAADTVRVRVRLKPGGPERRYRAGLAFVRQHVDLDVSPEVLAALQADPLLEVEALP